MRTPSALATTTGRTALVAFWGFVLTVWFGPSLEAFYVWAIKGDGGLTLGLAIVGAGGAALAVWSSDETGPLTARARLIGALVTAAGAAVGTAAAVALGAAVVAANADRAFYQSSLGLDLYLSRIGYEMVLALVGSSIGAAAAAVLVGWRTSAAGGSIGEASATPGRPGARTDSAPVLLLAAVLSLLAIIAAGLAAGAFVLLRDSGVARRGVPATDMAALLGVLRWIASGTLVVGGLAALAFAPAEPGVTSRRVTAPRFVAAALTISASLLIAPIYESFVRNPF